MFKMINKILAINVHIVMNSMTWLTLLPATPKFCRIWDLDTASIIDVWTGDLAAKQITLDSAGFWVPAVGEGAIVLFGTNKEAITWKRMDAATKTVKEEKQLCVLPPLQINCFKGAYLLLRYITRKNILVTFAQGHLLCYKFH